MIKKRRFKDGRLLTSILSAVIVMNISATAYAQEVGTGNMNGVGGMEGNVKTDIYQVVMPTDTDEIFNFILDPQGLINATNGAAYDGETFEENSTVFFKRTDGKSEVSYSNKSDFVTITNKGSVPIDVYVDVKVVDSSIEGIRMTDDKEFTDDSNASLYLAIVDGENEVPVGKDGASVHMTVDAAPDEAYEYVYDKENEKYIYKLKDSLSGIKFNDYSFQLTGAANMNGDWAKLGKVSPKIVVTWKVVEGEKQKPNIQEKENELKEEVKTSEKIEEKKETPKEDSEEKETDKKDILDDEGSEEMKKSEDDSKKEE